MISVVGYVDKVDIFLHYINQYLDTFHINTPQRAAHFMAQVCHETGGLKFLRELGKTSYFKKYDKGNLAKMLGNTMPGDGEKYKGRGLIHITGRANYQAYQDSGYCTGDIMSKPWLLEQPIGAVKSGMWIWLKFGCNALADKGDLLSITKKINGGTNGLEERKKWFVKWEKELCV